MLVVTRAGRLITGVVAKRALTVDEFLKLQKSNKKSGDIL